MKRFRKSYLILAAILVLTSGALSGCKPSNTTNGNGNDNGNGNGNGNGNETVYTINDYYPFTANLKTVYEGQGNEFASKTEYVDYITGDKIQIRSDNGGTVTATVLQNLNGELVQLNSKGEVYYKQDMTSETAAQNVVLLKEPLKTGTEWTLPDGTKRAITGVDVDVTTPSGDYKALEVTTTYTDSTTKDYYALTKGLVKSVWSSNGSEVSSSLKESVADAAYTSTVRIYNFQVTATDIQTVYKDVSVSLKTNEEIKGVFEKNFRETLGAGTYTSPLMSLNTAINSVYVKPDEGIAYVDFNAQFVSEMNAGTTKESGVTRSVANTLGYYYGVNKVIITLDGAQYSSGHIFMEPGDYFKTNYDGEKKVTGAP